MASNNSNNQHHMKTLYWDTLPVTPHIKQTAIQASLRPSCHAKKLSDIIKHCPAITLHIICRANQQLSFGKSEQCHTLEHAISLLGIDTVISHLQRMSEYSQDKKNSAYIESLKKSLYAAQLSEQFCQHSRYWQPHQGIIYFASLLQQSPLWAMYFVNPHISQEVDHIKATHAGKISVDQQKELLDGKSLHQLYEQTSRDWKLPQLCQATWEQKQYGNPQSWLSLIKELATVESSEALQSMDSPSDKHFSIQAAAAVVVSNNLSDAAHWDWESERCLRWQTVAAACTALKLEESIALSHQVAAENSRLYNSRLAVSLLSRYNQEQLHQAIFEAKNNSQDANNPIPENVNRANTSPTNLHQNTADKLPTENSHTVSFADMANVAKTTKHKQQIDDENFLIVVSRLSKQANSFNHFNAALQLALSSLQNIGFNRSMILSYNHTNKMIKHLFSQGIANNDALYHLTIHINDDPLLHSLSHKSISLQMSRNNQAQIQQQMSSYFKKAVNGNSFSLISIVKQKQLHYYLYADSLNPKCDAIQSYQKFQQLGAALNQCLEKMR